jgi:sialate O-acetylesterase
MLRQVTHENGTLRLWFEHAAGLEGRGGKLDGFTIVGARGEYVPADAKIEGSTVVLSNPQVRQPVAARYAWGGGAMGNLYNNAGLPAPPFRTKR